MSQVPNDVDSFVTHLERLKQEDDRAALARLRRSLGKEPGAASESFPVVQPWLPPMPQSREDAFYLMAGLFASHAEPGGSGNLGDAFAGLAALAPERRDAIERRFVALLNCHQEDLPRHLRQAISLLASGGVPVDWRRLLKDVLLWGGPRRTVQRHWARRFWAAQPAAQN